MSAVDQLDVKLLLESITADHRYGIIYIVARSTKKKMLKINPRLTKGGVATPLTVFHYENLLLKMTLKNHSYSENHFYKRKCYSENFSVLF